MELRFNRVAIKVGSNVLTNKDGSVDDGRIAHIVDQIAALRNSGVEVVLISGIMSRAGIPELSASYFPRIHMARWRELIFLFIR